ncbi:glycosyltransferase family 4 protein [Streptomyces sp. S07_1.15]|uniref:glycosyltransferase family 4 protein n=1 Tax=Streptomyces sp. S07_1.15 TaxID=2873925 RepID=UPI001D15355A|nr:glycosyltransferase family 4 protein [Streptomyces sp. S07_1.15]MCC3654917.1 glycosyltransferase family 4 protein [Streptomyces sp. S07_1.15]
MSSTPVPPHREPGLHAVHVLGHGRSGSGAQVRALAAGLVARGVRVTVCAPRCAERAHDFTGSGAHFAATALRADPATVAVLRAVCAGADVVHAHGLRAAFRVSLALGRGSVPLVVTWHRGAYAEGVRGGLVRLMERRAARTAAVVLGATTELVDRARRRGARDARLVSVMLPPRRPPAESGSDAVRSGRPDARTARRAALGAQGRPLLLAVGRLAPGEGMRPLLDAARAWSVREPRPLLLVTGDGPARTALQRRIDFEDLPVRLLGHRPDGAELVAAADVLLLPGRRDAPLPLVREALRAGVPMVAVGSGAVRDLAGDAAEFVPYGDPRALAEAVGGLLADPGRRERLRAAGRARAAHGPTAEDTVAQVLSVYDELAGRPVRWRRGRSAAPG